MVKRTRIRSIVIPILFYLALGIASGYLVWNASTGERGLAAKASYEARTAQLQEELDSLKQERERWERRVAGLSPQSVDRDLLDEEAHTMLNRVGRDELVIMTGPQALR